MKLTIRSADQALEESVIHEDPGYPTAVQIELSDGQVFQLLERYPGRLHLYAVKNSQRSSVSLVIIPRSSNLAEIRADPL